MAKIDYYFFTRRYLFNEKEITKFFEIIKKYPDFIPDRKGVVEPLRNVFDINNIKDEVNYWLQFAQDNQFRDYVYEDYLLMLKKIKAPKTYYFLTLARGKNAFFNSFNIELDDSFLKKNKNNIEILNNFIYEVVDWLKLDYGYFYRLFSKKECEKIQDFHDKIFTKNPVLVRTTPIYWGNYFGKSYIDFFGGKEKLLKTPCYKAEELKNGCIYIQLTGNFDDVLNFPEEYINIHNQVIDYLDPENNKIFRIGSPNTYEVSNQEPNNGLIPPFGQYNPDLMDWPKYHKALE